MCRVRKGEPPSAYVQQHVAEAMQPDGIDLEYVYMQGLSRPQSPHHTARGHSALQGHLRAHSAMRTSAGSRARPISASSFIQDDLTPDAPVDAWGESISRELGRAPPAAQGRRHMGTFAERPRSAALPPRPSGMVGALCASSFVSRWDDSPAGAPSRTFRSGSAQSAQRTLRPGSAAAVGHFPSRTPVPTELSLESHDMQSARFAAATGPAGHSGMLGQLEGLDLCASWASNEAAAWQRAAQTQEQLAGARLTRASSRSSIGGADQLRRTASIYSQQLNDLLSQANQCAAVLGSRYRYVAARQRAQSAASGRPASAAALFVERRAVNVRTCFQSI